MLAKRATDWGPHLHHRFSYKVACIGELNDTVIVAQRMTTPQFNFREIRELPKHLKDAFFVFIIKNGIGEPDDIENAIHGKKLLLEAKKIYDEGEVPYSPWHRPVGTNYKLNFDGGWLRDPKLGGTGWIIRDRFGSFCMAGASTQTADSVKEIEVHAIKYFS